MAKLKYEFLAHYNDANGLPLRSNIFAHIHALSRMASFMPSLANSMMSRPAVRKVLDHYVGIDARRKMPPIAQQTFESWFRNRKRTERRTDNRNVVLFHDTRVITSKLRSASAVAGR